MALLRVALAVLRPVFGGARLVLGLTFAVLRTNIVFFTGTAVGGALAKRGAARKTEAMWRAEALAEARRRQSRCRHACAPRPALPRPR